MSLSLSMFWLFLSSLLYSCGFAVKFKNSLLSAYLIPTAFCSNTGFHFVRLIEPPFLPTNSLYLSLFCHTKKCPLYVAKKYPLFCPLYLQPCPIAATLPFLMGIPLFKGFVTWLAFLPLISTQSPFFDIFFMKTPKSPGNLIDLRRGLSSPFGNICLKSQVAPFLPPFQPFFCFVSLSEMLYLCCPL